MENLNLYVMVDWPESQMWMDQYQEDIEFAADDATVFVPIDLYKQVNG